MSSNTAFQKRAIERKRYTVDYSCWLDEGEALSEFVIVIAPVSDPPLTASGAYADGTNHKLTAYLGGGKAGQTYLVSFIATTTQGQTKRDDLQMRVT